MGILRESMRREGRAPEPPRPGVLTPAAALAAGAAPAGAGAAPARSPAAPAAEHVQASSQPTRGLAGEGPDGRSELRRRRDALAEQVAEMHWDLGGLAYEMAIRDHFRLDVLIRRAASLQERDAELAEVERLLRSEEEGIAGQCPACRAPHSRGAIYCWQCGTTLMRVAPPSASLEDQPTAVMDSLLAPERPPWEGEGGPGSG